MQTHDYTFAAPGAKTDRIPAPGKFFILTVCPFPVDLVFFRNGSPFSEVRNKAVDWEQRFDTPFDSVRITSSAAQSIQWEIGDDGMGRYNRAGTATIAGTVAVSIDAAGNNVDVLTLPAVTVGALPEVEPLAYASDAASITALVAATPVEVVAPAANVNGIVVKRAAFVTRGTSEQVALLAKNGAPATVIDGDVILSPDTVAADGAVIMGAGKLEAPVFVPAGLGLYWIATANETAGMRSALLQVL